jgi:hypothetical protein
VLVPFANSRPPNVAEPGANKDQSIINQLQRGFTGLAGESRVSDGNSTGFHIEAVAPGQGVQPAPPADGGVQPPPRRPDVPCENQEAPNLAAPVARLPAMTGLDIPASMLPPGFGSLPLLPAATPVKTGPITLTGTKPTATATLKRLLRAARQSTRRAGR